MPNGSKLCNERWVQHCHKLHVERLKKMKPSIDNNAPKEYSHLTTRAKKQQLLEERYMEIELENRHLLEKMSRITQSSATQEARPYLHRSTFQFKPGMRFDGNGVPKLDTIRIAPNGVPASLNREARKRELRRITAANLQLLERIQGLEAVYSNAKLEKSYIQSLEYAANVSNQKWIERVAEFQRRQRPASAPPRRPSEFEKHGSSRPTSAMCTVERRRAGSRPSSAHYNNERTVYEPRRAAGVVGEEQDYVRPMSAMDRRVETIPERPQRKRPSSAKARGSKYYG